MHIALDQNAACASYRLQVSNNLYEFVIAVSGLDRSIISIQSDTLKGIACLSNVRFGSYADIAP